MIADDMMSFIKNDIIVFGIGVFIFIIFTLWLIFKNIKWVIIPLTGCLTSVVVMVGLLGLIGWKVTVISSNFIALMLMFFIFLETWRLGYQLLLGNQGLVGNQCLP